MMRALLLAALLCACRVLRRIHAALRLRDHPHADPHPRRQRPQLLQPFRFLELRRRQPGDLAKPLGVAPEASSPPPATEPPDG